MHEPQESKSMTSSSRATYQDVLDAPPHLVAEIIDGTLYTHPRPALEHSLAGSALGSRIGPPYHFGDGGPGGWWILFEPELHLGGDILVPDLAGWRRKRMPTAPSGKYASLAPDWACELLSPSTRHLDCGRKQAIYAREGVGHLWLVDPIERSLEAFKLSNGAWSSIDKLFDDAAACLPPFEEISFCLAELWPHTMHRDLPSITANETQAAPAEMFK